jgi:predicted dehydrogenase
MTDKCLIIGLGEIGMGYDLALSPIKAVYSHARAFSMHPAFELVCAVDPIESQRDLFIQKYARPAYPTIASALQSHEASMVVIASPTAQHSLVLEEILAHSSPKLILCEKPLAYELSEARYIVETCESAGVKLFVNYIRRSDPGAIEIKARIDSGQFAAPIKGVVWYSKGFLHNGSHFFNLLEYWLGPFVKARILDGGRLWDKQDPEPDVQVEFKQGKVVFLAAWEESFSHYTIELITPSGRLRYEQGGESIAYQTTHDDPSIVGYKILKSDPELITNGMYRCMWHVADQIAEALADRPHNLCTGRQALTTLEAMHQIINQR